MAIDPDVQDLLDRLDAKIADVDLFRADGDAALSARLDVLEAVAIPGTTQSPAPGLITLGPGVARIELPRGTLGPLTTTPIDPETAGVRWSGSEYQIPAGFSWDESADGGYLLFNKGRVRVTGDGVDITGAVFDRIDSGRTHVLAAQGRINLRQFRVDGGQGASAVGGNAAGSGSSFSNFEILGFDGDGVKPRNSTTFTDGYIGISSSPGSANHYDAIQVTGKADVTLARLRIRMDGKDGINAAVFIHDLNAANPSTNIVVTDIDIEHIPWCYYPVRLHSNQITVSRIIGRGPISTDGQRPKYLVRHEGQSGTEWSTIISEFDSPVPVYLAGTV